MIKVHTVSAENAQSSQIYYERDLTIPIEWGILTMLGFTEYILYTFLDTHKGKKL